MITRNIFTSSIWYTPNGIQRPYLPVFVSPKANPVDEPGQ